MDEIFSKQYYRRTFFGMVALLLLLALVTRFFVIPYFEPAQVLTSSALLGSLLDNFVVSLFLAVFLGGFVFWLTPAIVKRSAIEVIAPRQINPLLKSAASATRNWVYKRFTFIVQADFLNKENAVKEDWSGFFEKNSAWEKTRPIVQDKIREIIDNTSATEREDKRNAVLERVGQSVNALPLLSKDRVTSFVNEVVDTCPNFGENEIVQLSGILAKLEKSKSQYGLLEILHNQDPHDLDALHEVLSQWTIGMAKVGIGNEADPWGAIKLADLGYCEIFDFKCAANRTCDAWVVGGPDRGESEGEYEGEMEE